jgi:hypothetical protein
MGPRLALVITAEDPALRDLALESAVRERSLVELQEECAALERLRRTTVSLYERVRALAFLAALHRYHLPPLLARAPLCRISAEVQEELFERRFEEGIARLLALQEAHGASLACSSALAHGYRELAFQTLAQQVQESVRSVPENRWMFALERAADTPLRLAPELLCRGADGRRPVLCERTPVRMDLSHSGWSDIFFLAMDDPLGARVLNISIDLAVAGREDTPRPPVEAYLRVLDEPVLRFVSVDLGEAKRIESLPEVFDFGSDHLGLLRAAAIAAGLVPPGLEGQAGPIAACLEPLLGPGLGLELTSHVRGIPKGSRLAVSTTLLAALIAVCMRATRQTGALAGTLAEAERRCIASRAILGEWLGGSGGGWQDSGGLWPGIKRIEGAPARRGDAEHGVSRGRLLPEHTLLGLDAVPSAARAALAQSLVLVHGGLAQDIGPILEQVTERYLLRSEPAWSARREARELFDEAQAALCAGDMRRLGRATSRNFEGPLQTILPWVTNLFTERVLARVRARFGERFLGFWMLGGMSGGGMGFLFEPGSRAAGAAALAELMARAKRELEAALPFAMEPVVYEFAINELGSAGELRAAEESTEASLARRSTAPPSPRTEPPAESLEQLLARLGFDALAHERVRADLREGRIGIHANRLSADVRLEDVQQEDVLDARHALDPRFAARGLEALRRGELAVITLAGGSASRWTQGAGIVKALAPVCRAAGRERLFLEFHLAQTARLECGMGRPVPQVITTSHLTHQPIADYLSGAPKGSRVLLSPGASIGLRFVPMQRDLLAAWASQREQRLEPQAESLRQRQRSALLAWARARGEGSDYCGSAPSASLHPTGHFYEVPNMLLNGTLALLLTEFPRLRTLYLRNLDTLGAACDPALLGLFEERGAALAFEVLPRAFGDRGGGLLRVDGRPRLVEGLALPRAEDELRSSFYSSMSTWIDLERLLGVFGLARADLADGPRVRDAVRALAERLPTYVAIKEVKERWGQAQEDVYPVAQFERLWGDMSSLDELDCAFFAVPRVRGQQLKEPSELDAWVRDGSAAHAAGLCVFPD